MLAFAVSVCVPHYNGRLSVERCLQSVLEQPAYDRGDVELVVVDDCSTDGSARILGEFCEERRVRVFYNADRLGLAGNWQKTLALGRGEVVTLLHQDDWYHSQCLDAAIDLFDKQDNLTLAAFGQVVHHEGEDEPKLRPRAEVGCFTGEEYAIRRLSFHDCPAPSTTFIRRKALATLAVYYDSTFRFFPELDLYIRLALANPTGRFAHDPRLLVQRGAGKMQFSVRYPGYRILDTCHVCLRHIQPAMDEGIHIQSMTGARRQVARDLVSLLRRRDVTQLVNVLRSPVFRHWAMSGGLSLRGILSTLGSRGRQP